MKSERKTTITATAHKRAQEKLFTQVINIFEMLGSAEQGTPTTTQPFEL